MTETLTFRGHLRTDPIQEAKTFVNIVSPTPSDPLSGRDHAGTRYTPYDAQGRSVTPSPSPGDRSEDCSAIGRPSSARTSDPRADASPGRRAPGAPAAGRRHRDTSSSPSWTTDRLVHHDLRAPAAVRGQPTSPRTPSRATDSGSSARGPRPRARTEAKQVVQAQVARNAVAPPLLVPRRARPPDGAIGRRSSREPRPASSRRTSNVDRTPLVRIAESDRTTGLGPTIASARPTVGRPAGNERVPSVRTPRPRPTDGRPSSGREGPRRPTGDRAASPVGPRRVVRAPSPVRGCGRSAPGGRPSTARPSAGRPASARPPVARRDSRERTSGPRETRESENQEEHGDKRNVGTPRTGPGAQRHARPWLPGSGSGGAWPGKGPRSSTRRPSSRPVASVSRNVVDPPVVRVAAPDEVWIFEEVMEDAAQAGSASPRTTGPSADPDAMPAGRARPGTSTTRSAAKETALPSEVVNELAAAVGQENATKLSERMAAGARVPTSATVTPRLSGSPRTRRAGPGIGGGPGAARPRLLPARPLDPRPSVIWKRPGGWTTTTPARSR